VIDLELTWQEAACLAGILAGGTVVLRRVVLPRVVLPRSGRPRLAGLATGTGEISLILALFALWQYAGTFGLAGPSGALGRSRWIWHAERVLHLPSETSLQQVFLPHPLVIEFFNIYYLSLHFPVLIACMTWLFIRHRERYRRLRTTLVLFTGACLLIQLIPVAPPRMLPGTGLVDTAVLYHQSVYASSAGFDPDELSAMPSVHVGWALLVAIAVITTMRGRWRWLALLYPALTTLVVVVTANHFWLDGIVAAIVLGLVIAVQAASRAGLARLRARRAGTPGNSGLCPDRPAWDDLEQSRHTSSRGPNGNISTRTDQPRSAAERHRSA
jgi:hypothetical protein